MRSLRFSRAFVLCVSLALLSLTVSAAAKSNREFAGYYGVSDVQEQGDLVQVTLHLQLFNNGHDDVKSVIVTLVDSGPLTTFRGNFHPVKVWRSQQGIKLSQQFTVSKREFGEWMAAPGQPNLVILFQDAKGHSLQRGAQLSQRPLMQ
jgi:hypothetical protein